MKIPEKTNQRTFTVSNDTRAFTILNDNSIRAIFPRRKDK